MNKLHLLLLPLLIIFNSANCQSINKPQPGLLDSMTLAVDNNVYSNIHSILISKSGKLVYEHYFNGWNKDSLQDSRSSFKSVTSLLAGIAIDKGFIKDVHQKVYSYFPDYAPFSNYDDRKKEMTIKHLLEMKSGFDCEEFNGEKDCEDIMTTTNDWLRFSLDLPMKHSPGTVWSYTSCSPMIIGGIISHTAKMSIMDFAKKYLFEPLEIRNYKWTVDPSGHGTTAGSFYIRPADMLKLGEVVLQDGQWRGRKIISSSWLKESTQPITLIPDFSYVQFSGSTVATPQPAYYGYYWYTETIKTKDFQENVLFASGNGGQYIMIVKNLDLVIVFTQGNYNSSRAKRAFDILAKYILPVYTIAKH
jgi:CubicO group peptidase (beta-lactamase class C family)